MPTPAWTVVAPEPEALAAPEGWTRLRDHLRALRAEGLRALVVVPALPQSPALLEAVLHAAVRGAQGPALDAVVQAHRAAGEGRDLATDTVLAAEIAELGRHALAVAVMEGARPSLQARVLALGPALHQRLLAAWLTRELGPTEPIDARSLLRTLPGSGSAHWLAARAAPPAPDPEGIGTGWVALVPAGLAGDPDGELVLLRGGGPMSAALCALRAAAVRVDVLLAGPSPRTGPAAEVRDALPLAELDVDEAQALGDLGVPALHAGALELLRERGIPLHLHGDDGAPPLRVHVDAAAAEGGARLVHLRRRLAVVSVEGDMADGELGVHALGALHEHGLSVVVMAASRGALSVAVAADDPAAVQALAQELARRARTRVIQGCAAVSLVGSGLRSQLHRLGPALEALGPPRLRLVAQAADQRTLTVVLDDALAEPLARALHSRLPTAEPAPTDDDAYDPVSGGDPDVQSQ